MRTDDSILRDPTAEAAAERRAPVAPPGDLRAGTIALLDIGKMRGDEFVDRLAELLAARGYRLARWKKPTNTRTAPLPILHEIAGQASAVIVALSDCGSCTSCSTHDLNDLDRRGIPGVNVLTEEFRDAFDRQCGSLGFDGRAVFVPHPILNRTTAEIHAIAEAWMDRILATLEPARREAA
jgi:hypothetical protein